MIVYVGETRARELRDACIALGFGVCVVRGRVPLPPDGDPPGAAIERWPFWFYDNGAFFDHQAGRDFDEVTFQRDVRRIGRMRAELVPRFLVLPDRVAGGLDSLALSVSWISELRGLAPLALAVQDGIDVVDVPWSKIAGVFVGGSTRWKLETAGAWVEAAHARGKWCHVGRVGSMRRVAWARSIGVDSIDSALPLASADHFGRFVEALAEPSQGGFAWAAPRSRD